MRPTDLGHGLEVEAVERLAGWQARLDQMSLDASLGAFGEFQLGEGRQQPRRRPGLAIGALGEGGHMAAIFGSRSSFSSTGSRACRP